MRRLGFIRRAGQDRRGVTVTEFGLIAPTFLLLLLGVFDLGFTVYARAILDGAVQKGRARRLARERRIRSRHDR
ncbi:TadE/TadG family type IV pilus assembly protein [Blastomonas sp.]|uniref:TadE/TadG family type IV pilus assembly protein n=1 Tax=Blastomonas sp. TaxID=1909299 RepID=UPI0017F46EEF|nr:pilus assembly protein [Blastomonas sp.]